MPATTHYSPSRSCRLPFPSLLRTSLCITTTTTPYSARLHHHCNHSPLSALPRTSTVRSMRSPRVRIRSGTLPFLPFAHYAPLLLLSLLLRSPSLLVLRTLRYSHCAQRTTRDDESERTWTIESVRMYLCPVHTHCSSWFVCIVFMEQYSCVSRGCTTV